MNLKRTLWVLLIIFLIQVFIKIILSSFIHSPTIFADEVEYIELAKNFFHSHTFLIYGLPSHQYLPLYPILLSISFIFNDMNIVYFLSKCINAVVSSLIIFPAYLIAKEFLTSRKALLTAVVVSIFPTYFAFTPYILPENFLFPMILFAFYFIHKSFVQNNYKWDILAGVFIGISYLIKITSIILIPLVLILLIISLFKKEYIQIKKKIILFITAFLIVLPWLIRNILNFGFNFIGILGYAPAMQNVKKQTSIFSLISWIILHFGYAAIAVGIIFFIISLILIKSSKKDKNLFNLVLISWISLILMICITSLIMSSIPSQGKILIGRPTGRHIETVLSLFIILGFIGLNKKIANVISNKVNLKIILFLFILLGISSVLNLFNLFPVSNISLSFFGAIKYILSLITNYSFIIMVIIFLSLSFLFLIFYKLNLLKVKSCFLIFTVYFIFISLLSYSLTYYNSEYRWMTYEQTKMGLWFNSYDKERTTVLFDINSNLKKLQDENIKPLLIMAFWMNDNIIIGNETRFNDADYIISSRKLPFNIIKQNKDNKLDIFIYKK